MERQYPFADVHCIQDGAPELRVLPETLARMLPRSATMHRIDLVDFKRLMGYLEDVVDACEPPGDPYDLKEGSLPGPCGGRSRTLRGRRR